jgi:hypothetical protein
MLSSTQQITQRFSPERRQYEANIIDSTTVNPSDYVIPESVAEIGLTACLTCREQYPRLASMRSLPSYSSKEDIQLTSDLVWNKSFFRKDEQLFFPVAVVTDKKNGTEKAMIYARTRGGFFNVELSLLYYPRPADMQLAYSIEPLSTGGGPGELFPGSLAACRFELAFEKIASIKFIQSSVHISHAAVMPETSVTNDTFRTYGGRFLRLAETAFSLLASAKTTEVNAHIPRQVLSKSLTYLDPAAVKHGYQVVEGQTNRWLLAE